MAVLGAVEQMAYSCPSGPGCAGADPLLSLLQLEAQRSLNEAVCTELRSRIVVLWERLQVPAEERESSAVHMTGSRAKTREAVRTLLCPWRGGGGERQLWVSRSCLLSQSGGAASCGQV